ncbi:MAG: DUF4124 domain-containing protein [Rudaea sp.]|nr:DUF4124 domain-containing protein [Rudaea sp.]
MIPPPRGRTFAWLLALLAIVGAGAWWYFAPGSVPAPLRAMLPASPRAAPALYKWRDAKGGLHVTDVPPPDRPYETVRYDPNVNVVPSAVPAPARQQP